MEILQIGFIGFGLIGGSIAKALRAYRPQCHMIATSRSLSPLYQAQKDGVLDKVTDCVNEQFSGCDIIFICTPVVTITKYFELLKPLIKPSCILTDVGSVKESIYTAAKNAGLEGSVIIDKIISANKPNYGFDAQNEVFVDDMIAAGIVDPTKVTRSALENAASVAEMVLTTESLVADLPEPPAAPAAAGGDMGGMGGMY